MSPTKVHELSGAVAACLSSSFLARCFSTKHDTKPSIRAVWLHGPRLVSMPRCRSVGCYRPQYANESQSVPLSSLPINTCSRTRRASWYRVLDAVWRSAGVSYRVAASFHSRTSTFVIVYHHHVRTKPPRKTACCRRSYDCPIWRLRFDGERESNGWWRDFLDRRARATGLTSIFFTRVLVRGVGERTSFAGSVTVRSHGAYKSMPICYYR